MKFSSFSTGACLKLFPFCFSSYLSSVYFIFLKDTMLCCVHMYSFSYYFQRNAFDDDVRG